MTSLTEEKKEIWDIYKLIDHVSFADLPSIAYERPLPISRKAWNACGDFVCSHEKQSLLVVPSQNIITLRLDIKNMSVLKSKLLTLGFLRSPWDPVFANFMIDITLKLAKYYRATYAYTQSDEITLIIIPTNNPSYGHPFGGRRDKLVSESAARASILLRGHLLPLVPGSDLPIITFDSRLGSWNNLKDAFQLILWRAYDCGVNGISDCIHQLPLNTLPNMTLTRKELNKYHSNEKLLFLHEHQFLPMHDHQAYGTLIAKCLQGESYVYTNFQGRNLINAVKDRSLPGILVSFLNTH